MSVVARLLNRSFRCALHGADGALETELHRHHLFRSSCQRLLSNQTKPPPPQQTGESKPDQKPQASSTPAAAPQKPQAPQPASVQKPAAGAQPVRVSSPSAQPKPGVSKVSSTPATTGQKTPQAGQPAQKPVVATRAPAVGAGAGGGSGQRLQAHAAPGSGSGALNSKAGAGATGGRKLKIILASGLVGGLVLGLLYWQSPKLHDGPVVGEKDASGAQLPEEVEPENQVHIQVEPEPGVQPEEEAVVKIILEPEAVKVESSALGSGSGEPEKQVNEPEKQVNESSEERSRSENHTQQFITRIEPETLEKVVIEIEPSKTEEDNDTAVQATEEAKEPEELSKSILLEKGHDEAVRGFDRKEFDRVPDEKEELVAGLNLVAAIHAAEHRQAEIDAAVFTAQLQRLQEKHKHELSDVERKAASFHEEVRRLQEDMESERRRFAESLKVQQEQAEITLQERVKLMEEATQRQVEKAELLAKAEAANALIQERVNFLNDIGSVKVHMEAMNIALDAKSEEARESHEIRQLSLGSFAFHEALLSGGPVDKAAALILNSTGGDPLVEVALKSLPNEVLAEGTLTPAQLDRKLEQMETNLRELALIPASGGGLLCHLIARLATLLKLPDHGAHDDWGVDSVISQVQDYIREGHLLAAAETISRGLSGTNAESLAEKWASQARNRAILEQASALLRAHAATLALRDNSNT